MRIFFPQYHLRQIGRYYGCFLVQLLTLVAVRPCVLLGFVRVQEPVDIQNSSTGSTTPLCDAGAERVVRTPSETVTGNARLESGCRAGSPRFAVIQMGVPERLNLRHAPK